MPGFSNFFSETQKSDFVFLCHPHFLGWLGSFWMISYSSWQSLATLFQKLATQFHYPSRLKYNFQFSFPENQNSSREIFHGRRGSAELPSTSSAARGSSQFGLSAAMARAATSAAAMTAVVASSTSYNDISKHHLVKKIRKRFHTLMQLYH